MVALALFASSSGGEEPKKWRASAVALRIGGLYFSRGMNTRRGRMWTPASVGGIRSDGRSYRSARLRSGNWWARRGHC